MSVKITVKEFTVEGDTARDAAGMIARHFGCIADGEVPDAGLAIAHKIEETVETVVDSEGEDA